MSYMIEVYYQRPLDSNRDSRLQNLVTEFGGHLDFREVPADDEPGAICLTFDFEDRAQAEAAAEVLRRQGVHVEGPADYGPSTPSNGSLEETEVHELNEEI